MNELRPFYTPIVFKKLVVLKTLADGHFHQNYLTAREEIVAYSVGKNISMHMAPDRGCTAPLSPKALFFPL